MPYNGVNTGTSANSCSVVWNQWNIGSTDNSVTIWTGWATSAGTVQINLDLTNCSPPTEEELKQQKEEAERQRLAERRAKKLFLALVGRCAYRLFRKRKYHEVIGASGKRYRLGLGHRVQEMAGNFGDKAAASLCIHESYTWGLPSMDRLITQLLLLRTLEGEELLQKTANRTELAA
jgi:hypothetical protein